MKLSEMRELLAQKNIQLTKSLGQNFLHDGNQLRRIAAAAKLSGTDKVLEIGPGLGPLTELLITQAGEVLAIEKDRRLFEFLRERFATSSTSTTHAPAHQKARGSQHEEARINKTLNQSLLTSAPAMHGRQNLTLILDDALDYIRREPRHWHDWKLVANLPYSVASPILVELAQSIRCPQMMVATLQHEVARRIVARAGDEDYGILSLLLQLRYQPGEVFKIPADCFFPAPEVDSACVALVRREHPLLPVESRASFDKLVKLAFSQRRKMMLKLLKTSWPEEKLTAAFESTSLSLQVRAEKVTLDQFVSLTRFLQ